MFRIIALAFASYIVCKIVVDGSLFEKPRVFIERWTPFLKPGPPECTDYKHWIRCRLCFGFFATIFVTVLDLCTSGVSTYVLMIYGMSFILVFQERSNDATKQTKPRTRRRAFKANSRRNYY